MKPRSEIELTRAVAPIRTQVAGYLRQMIADGTLTPGERLIERELCERFGTSRSTVREAFRELESERLVEVVPGRGPIVATLSTKSIRDLYAVRHLLEQLAIEQFIDGASTVEMDKLESSFDALRQAHHSSDIQLITERKHDVYAVLFEAADNEVVLDIIGNLYARVAAVRHLSLSRPGRPAEGLAELEVVMAAIRKRDKVAARSAYETHMTNALKETLASLEECNEEPAHGRAQ